MEDEEGLEGFMATNDIRRTSNKTNRKSRKSECATCPWLISVEAQKKFDHRKSSDIQDLVCALHAATLVRSISDLGRFSFLGIRTKGFGLTSLKPKSLTHCLPHKVMRQIFRRCKNFTSSEKHQHQPLEGHAGTYGSRTKLAQVYPYLPVLPDIVLRHLKVKALDNEAHLLEDIFEPFTNNRLTNASH